MRNKKPAQFIILFLLLLGGHLHAQDNFSFSFDQISLHSALQKVTAQSGHRLIYSPSKIDLHPRITFQCKNQPLEAVLDNLLRPQGIAFSLKGKKLLLQPMKVRPRLAVKVEEIGTHTPVEGAQLYIPAYRLGVHTDLKGNGLFRELPGDTLSLYFRCIGFADTSLQVITAAGKSVDILLRVRSVPLELEEVVIQYDNLISEVGPAYTRLNRKAVCANQSVNEDPLAVIRMVPGIASTNSLYLNSGLHVRGGEPSENLTLLDNIQLPFPTFLNRRSVINPAFIEEVEVLTGGFSARYGNHLASVQNFRTRTGDFGQFKGKVRQSLWNSQVELEGPIIQKKVSVLGIVRRASSDWLWRDLDELIPSTLDVDFKLAARLNEHHLLTLTNLYVRDRLFYAPGGGREPFSAQANILSHSLQWQYFPQEKVFCKLGVIGAGTQWEFEDRPPFFARSRQFQLEVREDVQWQYAAQHQFKIGGAWERARVRGGLLQYYEGPDHGVSDSTLLLMDENLDADVNRLNAYFTAEGRLVPWLRYQAGLRYDQHLSYRRAQVSPRVALDAYPVPKVKINVTAGRYLQNPAPHLPRRFPDLRPSQAMHYIAGVHANPWPAWRMSAEVYRKNYRDLVVLGRDQQYTNAGAGHAQGLELQAAWSAKRLRATANYALAFSQRQRHFQRMQHPYYFNQRHVLNLWGIWEPASGKPLVPSLLQVDFHFASGRPFTPATGLSSPTGQFLLAWGAINSERLPPSHGLNLRAEWKRKLFKERSGVLRWYLALWNLYGYLNPVGVQFSEDPRQSGNLLSRTLTALPFFFDVGISFAF